MSPGGLLEVRVTSFQKPVPWLNPSHLVVFVS